MEIQTQCPHCAAEILQTLSIENSAPVCPHCQKPFLDYVTPAFQTSLTLDQCPRCGCPHVYQDKDFNKKWGLFLVVLGVAGAFFTYGLSLVFVTLIDWVLARRIKNMGLCYQCETKFRGQAVETLPKFDLELFDYYRNVKERAKKEGDF